MTQAALALLLLWFSTSPLSAQEDLPQLIVRIQPAVVTIIIFDRNGRGYRQRQRFFHQSPRASGHQLPCPVQGGNQAL